MPRFTITPHEPTTDEKLESLKHEICAKAMAESLADKKKEKEKKEEKEKLEQQMMMAHMAKKRMQAEEY
jgi:hypothetical protein